MRVSIFSKSFKNSGRPIQGRKHFSLPKMTRVAERLRCPDDADRDYFLIPHIGFIHKGRFDQEIACALLKKKLFMGVITALSFATSAGLLIATFFSQKIGLLWALPLAFRIGIELVLAFSYRVFFAQMPIGIFKPRSLLTNIVAIRKIQKELQALFEQAKNNPSQLTRARRDTLIGLDHYLRDIDTLIASQMDPNPFLNFEFGLINWQERLFHAHGALLYFREELFNPL